MIQNLFQDSDDDNLDVGELGVNQDEERKLHVTLTRANPYYSDYDSN
jgi:hypothetical protein